MRTPEHMKIQPPQTVGGFEAEKGSSEGGGRGFFLGQRKRKGEVKREKKKQRKKQNGSTCKSYRRRRPL